MYDKRNIGIAQGKLKFYDQLRVLNDHFDSKGILPERDIPYLMGLHLGV